MIIENIFNKLPYELRMYIRDYIKPYIKYSYYVDKEDEIIENLYLISDYGCGWGLINDLYQYICTISGPIQNNVNKDTEINTDIDTDIFNPYLLMYYDYDMLEGSRVKEWYWDDSGTDYERYVCDIICYLSYIFKILNNDSNEEEIKTKRKQFISKITEINNIYSYIIQNGEAVRDNGYFSHE